MKRRDFAISVLSPLALAACGGGGGTSVTAEQPLAAKLTDLKWQAEKAAKAAVTYMDEVVSYNGGYVWSYSPDLTQTFGEMEAKRTMLWLQPPGTSSIAHTYLDAYHATGHARFYAAAHR